MVRKILCLTMLSFLLAIGGLWGLRAQDPAPQKPATMQTTTQPDLSGTYAGIFNCEAAGLVGDTTLTINGNEFTTADGKTGRITASKTSGYTAVALQVNGADATATPTIISLSPSPTPTPTPAPSPEPAPSPSGSPTPMPSPTASPSPSPSEPMPSPTPSPSPSYVR